MNITAIRAALERLKERPAYPSMIDYAVVQVGLRACDEWGDQDGSFKSSATCDKAEERIKCIADIIRESGGEVEG